MLGPIDVAEEALHGPEMLLETSTEQAKLVLTVHTQILWSL